MTFLSSEVAGSRIFQIQVSKIVMYILLYWIVKYFPKSLELIENIFLNEEAITSKYIQIHKKKKKYTLWLHVFKLIECSRIVQTTKGIRRKKLNQQTKIFMLVWIMSTFDTFVISLFYLIGLLLFVKKENTKIWVCSSQFFIFIIK